MLLMKEKKFSSKLPYHHPDGKTINTEGARLRHFEIDESPSEVLPEVIRTPFFKWLIQGLLGNGWKKNNYDNVINSTKILLKADVRLTKRRNAANKEVGEKLKQFNQNPELRNQKAFKKAQSTALRLDYQNYKHQN